MEEVSEGLPGTLASSEELGEPSFFVCFAKGMEEGGGLEGDTLLLLESRRIIPRSPWPLKEGLKAAKSIPSLNLAVKGLGLGGLAAILAELVIAGFAGEVGMYCGKTVFAEASRELELDPDLDREVFEPDLLVKLELETEVCPNFLVNSAIVAPIAPPLAPPTLVSLLTSGKPNSCLLLAVLKGWGEGMRRGFGRSKHASQTGLPLIPTSTSSFVLQWIHFQHFPCQIPAGALTYLPSSFVEPNTARLQAEQEPREYRLE